MLLLLINAKKTANDIFRDFKRIYNTFVVLIVIVIIVVVPAFVSVIFAVGAVVVLAFYVVRVIKT